MECIIASGPVIIENGKVLLNQHGEDNFWKFPGGRVETDELEFNDDTLERACARETEEEMGIDVAIEKPLKPMLIKHPTKEGVYVVLVHFLAKRIGEITPGADIRKWDWFPIDNLPSDCAPNIRPVIEEYLRDQAN